MRKEMRFHAILLIVVIISAILVISSFAQSQDVERNGQEVAGRARDGRLPKIFDFQRFKFMFKKKYSSWTEELARQKIFLGRAFRAFISFISYKNFKSNSYLKISEMSDWTNEEHKAILTRGSPMANKVTVLEDPSALLKDTPVASYEDIELQLEQMPELQPLMGRRSLRRRRRDTSVNNNRENLQLEDLLGEPEAEVEAHEHIKSNNPNYEAPELTSFGTEDEPEKPMGWGVANYVSMLPGASFVSNLYKSSKKMEAQPKSSLQDEVFVDHRKSGCLNPAKNQKHCGSCYIFSTTALYEWQFCHETGKRVIFSEQYPLDCGERVGLEGCGRGLEYKVAEFYGLFGLELSSNYPYRNRADACPYDDSVQSNKMGYMRLHEAPKGDLLGVKRDYVDMALSKFPVIMGLGVADTFSDYGGGVDSAEGCSPENGHSMVMVGSGREDGQEYYLFRNSYGASWGLDGHYKLNKKSSHCFLDNGMGYFLSPKKGEKTVFELDTNSLNDPKYINRRFHDVLEGKPIERNPVNWIQDEDAVDPAGLVTPSSDSD